MAVTQNYEIQFGVSLTPAINLGEDQGATTKVMDVEIKKSLGGSGVVGGVDEVTVAASGTDVVGYTAGAAQYYDAYNAGVTQTIAAADDGMIFVKNTGFLYSTVDSLGDALTKEGTNPYDSTDCYEAVDAIRVGVKLTSNSNDDVYIAYLYPGEGIVLPRIPAATTVIIDNLSGSAAIAVEYAKIS